MRQWCIAKFMAIIILMNVIVNITKFIKRYNLPNDTFNIIEMTCEYNANCVVCIGGGNVIDNDKIAVVVKHEPMSRSNKPQDIDRYVAQVDQHQRMIRTQLNSGSRSKNEKPMPHIMIAPTTLAVATKIQDFIHYKNIKNEHEHLVIFA